MAVLWMLPLAGLMLIGMGMWQSTASLDTLWQRQERYLLARGLSPQRTGIWEQNVRRNATIIGVMGVVFLMAGIGLAASVPEKMSGVSVNGHELTQKQWDDCHHNDITCLSAYSNGRIR